MPCGFLWLLPARVLSSAFSGGVFSGVSGGEAVGGVPSVFGQGGEEEGEQEAEQQRGEEGENAPTPPASEGAELCGAVRGWDAVWG